MFAGRTTAIAILQSLYVVATTAIVAVLLAYPIVLAIVYTRAARACSGWSLLLAVAPFWTSYILRVYAWQILLAKRGVINSRVRRRSGFGLRSIAILNTQTATPDRPDPLPGADPRRDPLHHGRATSTAT